MAVATADRGALLEREESLSTLGELLGSVRSTSAGRLVLVSGEAGVGKTALLRCFCDALGPRTRVLWGNCDPLFTPRPLGPLLAVAEDAGGELAELVSGVVLPHELVAALVRDLRAQIPTVLVLEDVHCADEASLDVLKLLARRVETVPALIVASCRDEDLDRRHPLRIMLGELATNRALARIKLAALSAEAVASLAKPQGVDAGELYRKTGGNPFFVVEALAAHDEELPDTVRDVVFSRAARLSDAARQVLDAVAIAPPHAELWLLEALVGEGLEGLDECVNSGMLAPESAGVAFRHELARLAVEEAVPVGRRIELHRRALSTLATPAVGEPDLARLADHAEAAGDGDAVLRFAPPAAAHAASLGAHREAAAQYARALRFAAPLPPGERADLLERRSRECLLTDHYDDAIDALERALEYRRGLGEKLREGELLRQLSTALWCPGRVSESSACAHEAVAVLESLPPSRELARALATLASHYAVAGRTTEAISWGKRALDLAEQLGETDVAIKAQVVIGAGLEDYGMLEDGLERACRAGLSEHVAFDCLVGTAVDCRRHDIASRYLAPAIAHANERGIDLYRLYLLAYQARLELDRGRWSEAADSAEIVLSIPRTSTTPRIIALVVLALVRARRGDPEVRPLLDEAWALAEPTGELPRLGPVAAARGEVAWLAGRPEIVAAETEAAFDLAVRRRSPWLTGELACWRRRAGVRDPAAEELAGPYALELAGESEAAADAWRELGCPYEAALALVDTHEEEPLRRALTDLGRLGAKPAAAIVARWLRARGARGLPRGPYSRARENAAGLTSRELDVVKLLVEGLRNAQIAERLVLSEKTVDHHVSSVLRKLNVRTRGQAATEAVRLEVLPHGENSPERIES